MNEQKFIKENIVKITNRNDIHITGVQKVLSFSETVISLMSLDCNMIIQGQQMHAQKLDVEDGELIVSGLINMVKWEAKKEKIGLLKRIFK